MLRHKLLPIIESEFGSASLERLAETAEIAHAEEQYWGAQLQPLLQELTADGEYCLSVDALLQQPLAIRRRLVRAAAHKLNVTLEFQHVEQVLALPQSGEGKPSRCLTACALLPTREACACESNTATARSSRFRIRSPYRVRSKLATCSAGFVFV